MFEDLAEIGSPHDAEMVVTNITPQESVLSMSGTDRLVRTEDPNEARFLEMRRKRDEYSGRLKAKFGEEFEPEIIERVADLYFGPFSLHPEMVKNEKPTTPELSREERHKQRILSATIQHNLVHALYYAGSGNAGQNFVTGMYEIASFYENLSRSGFGHTMGIDSFWSGVKSELAIVKGLKTEGYRVFLPDYSQNDWERFPEDGLSSEVEDWDVKGHVDLIAEREGKILLVDAKGKTNYSDGNGGLHKVSQTDIRHTEEIVKDRVNNLRRLPPSMENFIGRLLPITVDKYTVTVPAGSNYMTPLAPSRNISERGNDELRNFATLVDTREFSRL
jgi:hypothetical protein